VKTEYEEGLTATFLGTVDDRIDATDEESQVDDTGEAPPDTQTKRRKVLSEAQANEIVAIAQQHPHQVVQSRQIRQSVSPPPPLTTASLQKLADSRYGFAPDHTMSVAQALFEQGLITYHRTDSVALSDDFCQSVREWLGATYPELVPSQVIKHRLKKAAQAAHEAIRPTKVVQRPDLLETTLDLHHLRLYELIWQRAVASQCAPAQVDKTWVIIVSGHTFWDVRGRVMVAPGYATIFNNLTTDMMLPNVPEGRECLDFCVSR
jgi:DNA topoisomerase-1